MVRKIGVAAVAVAATLLLTGCRIYFQSVEEVTETSARVYANGATGDVPAWYHFEWSRQEADIGTDRANRTPERGPIPPHVPAAGSVNFGETITGLSPGRLYFFSVCARQGAMTRDVCRAPSSFVTKPSQTQDYAIGYYSNINTTAASVQAASSPTGGSPDGWLHVLPEKGQLFQGRVTCLRVQGNRATVGAIGTFDRDLYDDVPATGPYGYLATVEDAPAGDRWDDVALTPGGTPPDCTKGTFEGFVGVEASFTVHDAP